MEIQQLKYFIRLAELEHMSNTAEELSISQPALSISIRKLEDEIGLSLFDREGRRIKLNAYGRIFLPYAKNIVLDYQNSIERLKSEQKKRTQTIKISIAPTLSSQDFLNSLITEFPEANINLSNEPTGSIKDLLKAAEIDFAILGADLEDDPDVSSEIISDTPMVALLPLGHPLADKKSITLADLKDEKFINHSRPGTNPNEETNIEKYCHEAGFEPNIIFHTNHVLTVINTVKTGAGISLVSAMVRIHYNTDGLAVVNIQGPEMHAYLKLYYRSKVKDPQRKKAIIDNIKRYFEKYDQEIIESTYS